jgi:transcriptional regulator with XRE-family HTH domain
MPRPPKKENEDNPLRKLRTALGRAGVPMPQHQLAELLGLSPETVKSIEAGRRRNLGLDDRLLDTIYVLFGANWSPKDRKWFSIGSDEPFTREHYQRWREASFDRDVETHALMLRLMLILDYAPERKFSQIANTVETKLQEVLKEFDYRPDNHDMDWLNTRVWIAPDSDNVYRRHRPIWSARKGLLFSFRYRRHFLTPREQKKN